MLCDGCGEGGVLVPLTFNIFYMICSVGLSNQIMFSGNNPVPFVFFSIIRSPLSYTYRFHRFAYLYVSALFVYSKADRYRLHLNYPLFLLMAVYSNRRDNLFAHSKAMPCSPFGVATLLQPVSNAKSVPGYWDSSWFHSSTFPLKRRW